VWEKTSHLPTTLESHICFGRASHFEKGLRAAGYCIAVCHKSGRDDASLSKDEGGGVFECCRKRLLLRNSNQPFSLQQWCSVFEHRSPRLTPQGVDRKCHNSQGSKGFNWDCSAVASPPRQRVCQQPLRKKHCTGGFTVTFSYFMVNECYCCGGRRSVNDPR
jgi:hypothetical protein